jgi:hypothetical protein
MRRALQLATLLAVLSSSAPAQDVWVDFDDRPTALAPIAGEYRGLLWNNFSTVGECPPEPWCPGQLSYPNVAINSSPGFASIGRVGGVPFTFLGGTFSTFTSWDTRILLEGFLAGTRVHDLSFVVTPNSLNGWGVSWIVDQVRFTGTLEDPDAPAGASAVLTVDDLVYDPAVAASVVPEPGSTALLGAGLVGLLAVRRGWRAPAGSRSAA